MKKLIAILIAVLLTTGIMFNGNCYAGRHGDHDNRHHRGHDRHHRQHSRTWAATSGFLGGLIIGSACSRPYYPSPCYCYPVYSIYGPSYYCYPTYYYPSYYTGRTTYY